MLNNLNGDVENALQIFDHVEENAVSPIYDLDPDLNFYNEYVQNPNLKYFREETFNFTYDQKFCK